MLAHGVFGQCLTPNATFVIPLSSFHSPKFGRLTIFMFRILYCIALFCSFCSMHEYWIMFGRTKTLHFDFFSIANTLFVANCGKNHSKTNSVFVFCSHGSKNSFQVKLNNALTEPISFHSFSILHLRSELSQACQLSQQTKFHCKRGRSHNQNIFYSFNNGIPSIFFSFSRE